MASKRSPNSRRKVSNRASGTKASLVKRRPIIDRSSFSNRCLAQAISLADTPIPAPRRGFFPASGREGCDSTGATTAGSVIMASAKLPVKHMPTAPTPFPPQSAWAWRASARSQSTIGLDLSVAQTLNSRRMQIPPSMVRTPKG